MTKWQFKNDRKLWCQHSLCICVVLMTHLLNFLMTKMTEMTEIYRKFHRFKINFILSYIYTQMGFRRFLSFLSFLSLMPQQFTFIRSWHHKLSGCNNGESPPNDGMTVVLMTGSVVGGFRSPFQSCPIVPSYSPPHLTTANNTNYTNDKMTLPKWHFSMVLTFLCCFLLF